MKSGKFKLLFKVSINRQDFLGLESNLLSNYHLDNRIVIFGIRCHDTRAAIELEDSILLCFEGIDGSVRKSVMRTKTNKTNQNSSKIQIHSKMTRKVKKYGVQSSDFLNAQCF